MRGPAPAVMIVLYTPPHRRVYGYYGRPFLLGATPFARCDPKADRARSTLMQQSPFPELGQEARRVAPELVKELDLMRLARARPDRDRLARRARAAIRV